MNIALLNKRCRGRAALAFVLVLIFAQTGLANRTLKRPELVFSTETRYPKIAGVLPLIAQPVGEAPVRYTKLSFEGERHDAFGPYAPHNSYSSAVGQRRNKISGEINFSYSSATDSIVVVNTTLVEAGQVTSPPPWHVQDGPFGVPPVLTVDVTMTSSGGISAGSNNPLGLVVIDATHAADNNQFTYWSNTQALYGLHSAVELQNNYKMTLSETDTPDQAESRAKRFKVANEMNSGLQHTIRQTYANGSPWTIRTVNVAFKFQSCPGLYEMVRKLHRRPIGTQAWISYKEERESRELEQGDWIGSFGLPLEEGYEVRLADMTFEAITGGCASDQCGNPNVAGHGSGPHPGSIAWNMPLGLAADGRSAGILSLYSLQVTPALYTPTALTGAVSGPESTINRVGGVIRQILAPQALVDVVVTSADSYDVRVYDRTLAGNPGGDGIYAPTGSPYVIWRVDNPGGSNRWRMSRIIGSDVDVTLVDESSPGLRVFSEANGLRVSEITQSTEGADRVETIVVKNAAGTVSSKKKVYYRTFNLGEEKVKEILDPDGAALTTIWTYSTSPNQTYQKLLSIQHPDGHVESMQYSSETGDLLTRSVPYFRNTIKGTSSSRTLSDLNADGSPDRLWSESDSVFSLSSLGARHTIDWGGVITVVGQDYTRRESKVVTSPGAAWNSPSNITTKERHYSGGANDGRLAYRLNPDGTLLLARHESGAIGTTITTEEQGAADPTGETVVDGTRTVRTLSARGFPVTSVVTDIATGLVLSTETVGQTDAFGRPTEILHTDGAVETRAYCQSCGAVDHIELRGETVNYEFDALKRKVGETRSAGSTVLARTRFQYDADGRLLKTFRVNPTDSTETLLASTTYDLAGRVAAQFSLESGTTAFSYVFGAQNSTIATTTYADGGTRIESRGPSGTVFKVEGTTAVPTEINWSARSWDSRGTGYLVRVNRYYTPTAFLIEESGVNYLGEVADTTFPVGARINRYFDSIGRLARTVDQDGITTLYGYDNQGRQSVTAVDLNGNGTIDYNGTDRISRSRDEVGTRDGHTVRRAITEVWETDGADTPITVSVSEQSADGLRSWQTVRGPQGLSGSNGLTASSVSAFDGNDGRTVTATAPDGTQSVQTYLGDRLQSAVTSHPSLGQLASVTYSYNDLGQLTTTTDARTGATTYTYDATDRLHTVTTSDPDPARTGDGYDPQVTTYAYDVMGRPTSDTQPDGGVVNTTYYPTGAVRRTWGSRTTPVEYTYDIQNRVKTLTTWQDFAATTGAAVTTWNYTNERGFLLNKRYADNTGPSYGYKPSGRLQTRTWARGVSTSYTYNAAGDLTGVNYSDATPDVTLVYDRSGRAKTITDGSGTRTLAYDASGQLDTETYTAGLLTGLGVDRGFDSLSRLSGLGMLVTGYSLPATSYTYDSASRLDTVTQGTNTAQYGYLANSPLVGSVLFKQGPDTRLTTTKAYDNLNRLGSITNTSSVSSVFSVVYLYNAANQRTKATREDAAHWDYGYDALGQVTSGKKSTAANVTLPGHDFAWTYDDIGNRRTATANASTSTYSSNSLNQYTQKTVPGSFDLLAAAQPGATVTYQYPADTGTPTPLPRTGDLLYAQLTADNSAASVTANVKVTGVKNNVGPNGEDAVTEITRGVFLPQTPELFTHDADGNLTADARWTYDWDAENRLVRQSARLTTVRGENKPRLMEFAYDFQGRRVEKKVTRSSEFGVQVRRDFYDSALLADGVVLSGETGSVDFTIPNRWHPTRSAQVNGYSIRWTGTLTVPASGTWTLKLEESEGHSYRLWMDGVLQIGTWPAASTGGSQTVTLSLEAGKTYALLVDASEPYGLSPWGSFVTRLKWSGPGVAEQVVPAAYWTAPGASDMVTTTRNLYDGWNLLAEVRLNPSTSTYDINSSYTWGLDLSGSMQGAGGVGGLLFSTLQLPSSTSTHASACDGNGNIIGLVDMATGAKSATYEYGVFGETLIADGVAADAMPFKFSTRYTDNETGIIAFPLRPYSPSNGRFLCKDPIGELGGVSVYGFVGNNPISYQDPLGLCCLGELSDWKIEKVYECFDGQSDEEFLTSIGVPAAIIAGVVSVYANIPPTPTTDKKGTLRDVGMFAAGQAGSPSRDWADAVKDVTELMRFRVANRRTRMAVEGISVCVRATWKKCENFLWVFSRQTEKDGMYEHKTNQSRPASSDSVDEAKKRAKEVLYR